MSIEILVNNGIADSTKQPEVMEVVYNHPVTKQRGHYLLRRGAPQEVWDRKARRMKVVVPTDVEKLRDRGDGEQVFILGEGYWGANDFQEISEELAESRGRRRRNKPLMAPPAALIEEACRELELRQAQSFTNPDTGHRWVRPSIGLLVPRSAQWANALAEQSKRDWRTGRSI